ncbi:MAG: 50S ribosomal protein L13 [Gemmatimonadetes bacterium]|nr:50S ribosomal protein L13 [Gemmatimonadota bacterium]
MKAHVTKASEIQRDWVVIDAQGAALGRLASEVATLLRGKHKPNYSTHLDTGDNVVIVNADKVALTGKKAEQKQHWHYSGFPGGMKYTSYGKRREKAPTELVRRAVRGMLPHNRLGRQMLTKVRIYVGGDHPHAAQNPKPYSLKSGRRVA